MRDGSLERTDQRTLERRVKQEASDRNVRLEERALVRHDSPAELVRALILFGVRGRSGTKEGDAQDIAPARKSVLALGQDCDTVAELAEVGELPKTELRHAGKETPANLVAANFELGRVPRRVSVRGPGQHAELRIIDGGITLDGQRKLEFQKEVVRVPVDSVLKADQT